MNFFSVRNLASQRRMVKLSCRRVTQHQPGCAALASRVAGSLPSSEKGLPMLDCMGGGGPSLHWRVCTLDQPLFRRNGMDRELQPYIDLSSGQCVEVVTAAGQGWGHLVALLQWPCFPLWVRGICVEGKTVKVDQ